MDAVFKALADSTRRGLIEALQLRNGQTLTALASQFSMTRFGVMKHLRALEEAGIVKTVRCGRSKLHYLDQLPILEICHDWVIKCTEMSGDDAEAEGRFPKDTDASRFEIFIRTAPNILWDVLATGGCSRHISVNERLGHSAGADMKGKVMAHRMQNGTQLLHFETTNLETNPPHRLVQSLRVQQTDDALSPPVSVLTWSLQTVANSCRLVLLTNNLCSTLQIAWPLALSSIKSMIETGTPLTVSTNIHFPKSAD